MSWWLATSGAQKDVYQAASASAAQARHPTWTIAGPYSSKAAAQGNAPSAPSSPPASTTPCQGGGGTGTRYTYAELEGLWINAGGSATMAPIMAAIAEAESGGCSTALGGVGEKGLWQVNPNAWGNLATFDPAGNASAAVHILAVQGLTAWSTYTSGAYKAYVSGSTTPNTNVPSGTGTTPGGTTTPATLTGNTSRCLVGGGSVFPCLIDASQARALIGGACILAGGLMATVGLVLLMITIGGPAEKTAKAVPGVAKAARFVVP